jgi:predicted small lipoprotein YifL
MKKILSIAVAIAAIFAIASCGGNEKKKADPAAKTVETLEKLYDQLDDNDAFIETFESMGKYYEGLSESDKDKADKAKDKWMDDNYDKAIRLNRAINSLQYYGHL